MAWPADQTSIPVAARSTTARFLGLQAPEGGDDAVDHPGTKDVAPAQVGKSDDANVPEDFGPDGTVRKASPNRIATAARRRGLLAQRTAALAGQGHVGSRRRVSARPEGGAHQPLRLDLLVAGQGVGDQASEHLLQDAEFFLDLGNIESGHETVRGDLLRRRHHRLGAALAHTLDDEPEQIPDVTTALPRAGCPVVCLIVSLERGDRFVDYPLLGAGEDR